MENNKNLSREETLAMISHELRTSLTASKWIIEMMQDGDVGELTIPQKEILQKLSSSNSRMMDIANNLILLSKNSGEENEYHMGKVDIIDLIDSVIFELGPQAFKEHIALVYVKPENEFPFVKGDETKLRIVFQNVIDNAIKYSSNGDRVYISLSKDEKLINISIKDTGIGIKEQDLPLITNQFYRASNAVEKAIAGSGIGLYICKRIIDGHGGVFNIESIYNGGTTITISLPISL